MDGYGKRLIYAPQEVPLGCKALRFVFGWSNTISMLKSKADLNNTLDEPFYDAIVVGKR